MVAIFNKPSAEDVQPLPQEMAQALDSAARWILDAVQRECNDSDLQIIGTSSQVPLIAQ